MPRRKGWGKRAKPKPSQKFLSTPAKGPDRIERHLDWLNEQRMNEERLVHDMGRRVVRTSDLM
jgi:hypothetical protein